MGLSALRVARAMTDARIVVADISAEKRALAEANGADATIDTTDPDAGRRLKEQSGAGVAASVDFVGMQETSQVALDSLRRGGTHVVVGLFGGELKVSVADYIYGLLAIRGSHLGTPEDLGELIDLRRKRPHRAAADRPPPAGGDQRRVLRVARRQHRRPRGGGAVARASSAAGPCARRAGASWTVRRGGARRARSGSSACGCMTK